MLESFGDHALGQRLHFGYDLAPVGTVAEHTRQSWHLGDPPAVVLTLQFNREPHELTLHADRLPNKRLQPTGAAAIMRPPRPNGARQTDDER